MAAEGAPLDIPPLLKDPEKSINFLIWQKRFKVFIKAKDPRLWRVIEFGDYIPRKVTQDGKSESSYEDEFKMAVKGAPPLLVEPEKFINFILWKKRFEFFVKAQNLRLWEIIEFGNGEVVTQESEWSEEDETKVRENYLALHMLYCALHDDTFNSIFSCGTAHDIWKTLAVRYEGISRVKDARMHLLTREFEAFHMLKGENIDQMYGRFNRIIISLKALGKTFTIERSVERFLTALPYKWNMKVSVISQNRDLYARSLEDLIGHLKVIEINKLKKKQRTLMQGM